MVQLRSSVSQHLYYSSDCLDCVVLQSMDLSASHDHTSADIDVATLFLESVVGHSQHLPACLARV